MTKRDLLLEVGVEEIPARFILDGINDLKNNVIQWLDKQKISYGEAQVFSTPRRLAILVRDVAESQEDLVEEAKGPAKKIAIDAEGNWTKAAIGFTRSQGMSVEDIYFSEVNGVEYAHVKKFVKGKKTFQLLQSIGKVIEDIHFPNYMRWGSYHLRFVRPIRWIVALYGDEVIPISIEGVQAGNVTRGHRFLGKEITINEPTNYKEQLENAYVYADYDERKAEIIAQINQLEEKKDWKIPIDEGLLEEVTNLVEYPTVFFGSFNEEYLNLPEEVLITSMKEHQRYFPVRNLDGTLLAHFVSVRNGDSLELDNVKKGNEKVLRARLADADFFYNEDKKMNIDDALEKLKTIIYHEKIGTLSEKVNRSRMLASNIAEYIGLSDNEKEMVNRAAQISKFDLVSNMVNEFPELQGIMGEKYALEKGEKQEVAQAIREHYQPRHAEDDIPASTIGAIISIADKLDAIVSSFAIGLIPTGSQDPYALRRQATGIIQILLEKKWMIPLKWLLEQAIVQTKKENQEQIQLYKDTMHFFKLRLKYILLEKGIRHDLVDAVLEGEMGAIVDIVQRAKILEENKGSAQFKLVIESLSRVLNISTKAEEDREINPELFENEYERNLYESYLLLVKTIEATNDAEEQFTALSSLQQTISEYFDHTMVMAESEKLKENRLAQMKQLAKVINRFGAMNTIQVK